jgi:hypothetical protein
MSRGLAVKLLLLVMSGLLGACATSDAPLTRSERRDLAWQSRIIRDHYRAAQSRADESQANGTLIVIPRRGAASSTAPATLVSGSTPGQALLTVPPNGRAQVLERATCAWVTRTGVVARPFRMPCDLVREEAELLDRSALLTERARELAVELDSLTQTTATFAEGLAKIVQLTEITDARVSALDDSVKILTESSTKAGSALDSVAVSTRKIIAALEAEQARLAKQLQDIQTSVSAIK